MEIRKSISVNTSLLISVILIAIGITLRLVPHMPNFAPIGAIALFGGAMLGWRYALWLPLSTMMLSDLIIGFYPGIEFTWISFLVIALVGIALKNKGLLMKIGVGGVTSATIFFVISNFGVWVASGMYTHTLAGFVNCYTMALPFFRGTLMGDVFYSGVLFGLQALAVYVVEKRLRVSSQFRSLQ